MNNSILIIGGTGEMGQWFAKFFKREGFEVTLWGSSQRVDIADKLGVNFASDLDNAIEKSDIVIVSVPIDITEKVISETAPKMKPGSLLMDFTSIKTKPVEAMKKYAPETVEILGTHPMFGPSIPSLYGQIVIMTPISGRCDNWFPVVKSVFENNGAHIEVIDPKEHDKFVSVVQGLTHFAYITIGSTFKRLDFDVSESRKFMSPVYDIMIDFVGRIIGQNPYLYALIQMENPEVLKVHDAFKKECNNISETVRQHDVESFVENMKSAASHFGDTTSALHRSDKLINSKLQEFDQIAKLVGKECGLVHRYSGATHVGVVEKVKPRHVVLSKPYQKNKSISLKIENVRLLSENELRQWKINNLKHITRDISVFIPTNAVPETIKDVISNNANVVDTEIIDKFSGFENIENLSITYRITVLEDSNPNLIQDEVKKLLERLGCYPRS